MLATSDRPARWTDAVIAALLGLATVGYLWAWPRNLGASDEAYYLFHAKRMLAGEILYRDMFDFITPLFTDLMALLFRLFGTDMLIARAFNTFLHAGIVVIIYLTCRLLRIRPALAAAAAVAHLALGQPAWPYASPHWLSTFLVGLLFLLSIDRQRARRVRSTAVQGLLLGTLLLVQQQKGVVIGLALGLLLLFDHVLDRWYGHESRPSVMVRAALLAGAGLVVVIPLMAAHMTRVGVEPILRQLILYPFTGYGRYNYSPWGAVHILSAGFAKYVHPALLKYLPAIIPILLLRVLLPRSGGRDRKRVETLLVLSTFAVFSVLSIFYFPDFIHLTFIAPVLLVCVAETLTSLLSVVGRGGKAASLAIAVALLVFFGLHLRRNLALAHGDFRFSHHTAFGRIDFASEKEIALVERVRALMRNKETREIFCYPVYAALYLMTDTDNPTPHEIILPVFQSDAELERVIDILEERRVPLVVLVDILIRDGDPVAGYVRDHYRCDNDGVCLRLEGPTG